MVTMDSIVKLIDHFSLYSYWIFGYLSMKGANCVIEWKMEQWERL